jgi:FKBP-type peptidyl-prolyl cis-trans isomerase FkpA
MKNRVAVPLLLLTLVLFGQRSVSAQGAVQAVRGAADGLQQQAGSGSAPLTAGPADKQEKVAPGKIDSDARAEFTETPSGLKYRILRNSTGQKPAASDSVEVHYKGWLSDGTIFDSSYRRGKTISFPLRGVIKGWTEGMQLVGQGGMIELLIPYQLGYGERGTPNGPIPPRAELHFLVELVSIKE